MWMQTGFKDGRPGWLRFNSHNGLCTLQLDLDYHDGLYYYQTDVFTVDRSLIRRPGTHRLVSQPPPLAQHVALPDSPSHPNLSRWSWRSGFFVWVHWVSISRGCTGEFSCAKAKKVLVPRTQETRNQIRWPHHATSYFYPGLKIAETIQHPLFLNQPP